MQRHRNHQTNISLRNMESIQSGQRRDFMARVTNQMIEGLLFLCDMIKWPMLSQDSQLIGRDVNDRNQNQVQSTFSSIESSSNSSLQLEHACENTCSANF